MSHISFTWPTKRKALQYGIGDVLFAVFLGAVQAFLLTKLAKGGAGSEHTAKLISAVILGLLPVAGSFYITHRHCTQEGSSRFWERCMLLVSFEVLLIFLAFFFLMFLSVLFAT